MTTGTASSQYNILTSSVSDPDPDSGVFWIRIQVFKNDYYDYDDYDYDDYDYDDYDYDYVYIDLKQTKFTN